MKTVVAISLSFLVFFQSVGIGVFDIIMLTDLVDHARFHSQEYGDDFFTFFEKHYGALKAEHERTHQEERPQHEKLPFQHYSFNQSLSEVVVFGHRFSLKKPFLSFIVEHHPYYQDLYFFLEKAPIFQPPKTV